MPSVLGYDALTTLTITKDGGTETLELRRHGDGTIEFGDTGSIATKTTQRNNPDFAARLFAALAALDAE